jgi:hypothetical protein
MWASIGCFRGEGGDSKKNLLYKLMFRLLKDIFTGQDRKIIPLNILNFYY